MAVEDTGGRMQVRQAQKAEPLHVRIGKLRDAARAEAAAEPAPVREQVGLEDGSIRLAAHLAGQDKSGAERRQAMSGVQVGKTVTAQGVAKTLLSRAEKIDRVKTWASSLTEEQRTEYMIGEKYGALSENAQDVIAEAFGQIDEQEANAIDPSTYDFDQEPVDVDALTADDPEDDDEAGDTGTANWEAMFEQAAWEAEQT